MDVHAAELGAAVELGEDLAGVEDLARVEGAFDPLLLVQVDLVELERHQVALFDADAVLAGQDAADLDAKLEDFGAQRLGALQLARLVGIVEDQGVQVAVAGMEHVGDPQAVVRAQRLHALQDIRQLAARDRAVHAIVVGRDPADRGEGRLAAEPEALALGIAGADPDVAGAVLAGDAGDQLEQMVDLGGRAVQFADQQGLHIERIARMAERLGGVDRRAVHHLQAARDDAGRDDRGDAITALLVRREAHEHGACGRGLGQDPDGDLGNHAQQALGAGQDAHQVIAIGIQMLAAQPDDLARRQDQLQTHQVVGGQAVFQAMHAA